MIRKTSLIVLLLARFISVAVIFLFFVFPAVAAVNPIRHALVIGNGDYQVGPLKNPVNDSLDMRELLQKLGFEGYPPEKCRPVSDG